MISFNIQTIEVFINNSRNERKSVVVRKSRKRIPKLEIYLDVSKEEMENLHNIQQPQSTEPRETFMVGEGLSSMLYLLGVVAVSLYQLWLLKREAEHRVEHRRSKNEETTVSVEKDETTTLTKV